MGQSLGNLRQRVDLIIYAAHTGQRGYRALPNACNPFSDSENPKRIAPLLFGAWVTAYYKHPAYFSSQESSILSPASLIQNIPEQPEQPYRSPTIDAFSKDELATILELDPNEWFERLYIIIPPSLILVVLEKTLLGADKSPHPRSEPSAGLKVSHILPLLFLP
ncbi:hypothetical protein ACEPAG_2337 [Sanghuangporus baumii]